MGSKSRLKVGIYFNARREQGGLYQYALTLVDCLREFSPENNYFLYHATLEDLPLQIEETNWYTRCLPQNQVRFRMGIELALMTLGRWGWMTPLKLIPEFPQIHRDNLDVMIYVKPTIHSFQWQYRFLFPIHDLQHRLQPEFPEVSAGGEFNRREYMYRNAVPKAAVILTDSETGKEDVIQAYAADPKCIFPLPYIAPTFRPEDTDEKSLALVKTRYDLPQRYLFYPAAFWQHKNHLRLVKAIAQVRDQHGVEISLLLAGSKKHEYEKVAALVSELELENTVRFLGYVPDEDLAALYHMALALVMPTFFGPTNIPILEAWAAECAVITSDLRGIREQVGDAGILVDPRSEEALAAAVWKIASSGQIRQELIQRGISRVKAWTPEKFAQRLEEAIQFAAKQI